MAANREQYPERGEREPSIEQLAEQLRRLPKPDVPDGLQEKLLAAIPTTATLRKSSTARRRYRRAVIAIVATAAGIAFVFMHAGRPPEAPLRPQEMHTAGNAHSMPHSLAIVDVKETDPCNILPPLPD
jgi:hypothetical protein